MLIVKNLTDYTYDVLITLIIPFKIQKINVTKKNIIKNNNNTNKIDKTE